LHFVILDFKPFLQALLRKGERGREGKKGRGKGVGRCLGIASKGKKEEEGGRRSAPLFPIICPCNTSSGEGGERGRRGRKRKKETFAAIAAGGEKKRKKREASPKLSSPFPIRHIILPKGGLTASILNSFTSKGRKEGRGKGRNSSPPSFRSVGGERGRGGKYGQPAGSHGRRRGGKEERKNIRWISFSIVLLTVIFCMPALRT